jgi:superfamily II DNA or RNA helicase
MAVTFTEDYRKMGDGIEIAPDQEEGINFLLSRQGALLSFGTGLGKTLTSLVAMKILLDTYPNTRCVIVCPVKALKAFKHEIFARVGYNSDEVGIIATNEMTFDIISNKVVIITDTNIEKYSDAVADIAARGHKILLIVDEAHKLQDKTSKFYNSMLEVRSICTVWWALTATPILNDLDSLYNIVDFFVPGFLGKKTAFDNRYTVWHLRDQYVKGGHKRKVKVIDGYQNLDELNAKLKNVMIVRQKQYNLKFGNIFEELTPEEYEIYEKVSSGIINSDDEKRNFSRRLHDLQRFVDRSYDEDESLRDMVKRYNSSQYSTKEAMLMKALKKTLEQGYSVIIYADYHDTIHRLHKVLTSRRKELGLENIFEITGAVDIKMREKVEEKIGNRDVILITSAGSESINLQRANCVIFYDIPFSVKTIIQVVGRVCRRDTKHKYQYILTLYTKGTVDEYKFKSFQSNLAMVQQSVGAGSDLPLASIGADLKSQEELKNSMLWHYKSGNKKERRKVKKLIKNSLAVSTLDDASTQIARNKFLVEPLQCIDSDISIVSQLFPDVDLYKRFISGEIPFTILRAKYLEYLRSDVGRKLIKSLQAGVQKNVGILLLVGNTDIPKVLMQEVLDQYTV